jgi:hypothetical protein
MHQPAAHVHLGPEASEYSTKMTVYFAGVLVVPDLLEDSEGTLEVRDTLFVVLEENDDAAETKQDISSPCIIMVVTLRDF